MCGIPCFITALFFLLVVGPQVMLLHAQTTDQESPPNVSTPSYRMTTMHPVSQAGSRITSLENSDSYSVSTARPTVHPTTGLNVTTKNNMSETESDSTIAPTPVPSTAPFRPITDSKTEFSSPGNPTTTEESEAISTIVYGSTTHETVTPEFLPTWHKVTSRPADTEATTEKYDTTIVILETTTMTEAPQTSSPAVATFAPTTADMEVSEITSMLVSSTEQTVATTPSIMATTNPSIILTTQHRAKDPFSDIAHIVSDFSSEDNKFFRDTMFTEGTRETEAGLNGIKTSEAGAEKDVKDNGSNWLIIIIIMAVVIVCVVTTFCAILVKRKKKRGTQNFGHGYANGRKQRSKKKKGEDDAWAGPVNLEGGQKVECEDPEEGTQGGANKVDKADAVLSTFSALEENGGIGRPGSTEVQKWEEKEPLLYIDEDTKGEGKEKQKESVDKAEGGGQKEEDANGEKQNESVDKAEGEGQKEEDSNGKAEIKEPELNGGEAFCLTTAV